MLGTTGLPFSLKAVGKTSLLIEPQGKKSGKIFVSSPVIRIKFEVILVIRAIINFIFIQAVFGNIKIISYFQ